MSATTAATQRRHPPGPRRLSWASKMEALRDVVGFSEGMQRQYGDLVRFRVGPMVLYQVTDPQLVQELLGRQHEALQKPARMQRLFRPWLGGGVLFSEGAAWKSRRRFLETAMRAVDSELLVNHSVRSALKEIEGLAEGRVDIAELSERIVYFGLLGSVFGDVPADEAEQSFHDATFLQADGVHRMSSLAAIPRWMPTPHNRRYQAAMDRFRKFIWRHVERRRRAPGGDLASQLLAAQAASGGSFTDDDLFFGITNVVFGGKVGVTSLTWAMFLLSRHLDTQRRAAAEVVDTLGRDATPRPEQLGQLKYIELILKESFRLFPPVPMVTREPTRDIHLAGYRIPRKSFIYIGIILMHRDPRWCSDPMAFRPERFVAEAADRIDPLAYVPFGGGPHVCVGRGMAMRQLTALTAAILSKVQLNWPAGQPDPALKVDERLNPAGPLWLDVAPRQAAAPLPTEGVHKLS